MLQCCAGQKGGCEAAIHAMQSMASKEETEGVLLIDAENAFNSLNRMNAMANIQALCPSLAKIVINTYRTSTDLYIQGECIKSEEGITQGDPLAMSIYAIGILPLICKINDLARQIWYADDAAAADKLTQLKEWWDEIVKVGPDYGYFVNPGKTWLIVREEHFGAAESIFHSTGIKITATGQRYLGSAVGEDSFKEAFVKGKVEDWVDEIIKLSKIAETQPQAAYCALTHSLSSKWMFLMRSAGENVKLFCPLEEALRNHLILALTGRRVSDIERKVMALPTRLGGLGIPIPMEEAKLQHEGSTRITKPLVECMLGQVQQCSYVTREKQSKERVLLKKTKRSYHQRKAEEILSEPSLSMQMKKALELAREKGASNWVSTLPIGDYGFDLHKGAFRDAIALRYGWKPENLPKDCVCGKSFSVEHALSCSKGGFPTIRHNEVRDYMAELMKEVCTEVSTEPELQPITGEVMRGRSANVQEGARLDVRAKGFWQRGQDAFFDVRVFNPLAPSNRCQNPYEAHEKVKCRAYEQRVREVERGTFTPLVMSATGGMGKRTQIVFKRLASMIASKKKQHYSRVMNWMRCVMSYSLLRSAIMCLRGSQCRNFHANHSCDTIQLSVVEGRVPFH